MKQKFGKCNFSEFSCSSGKQPISLVIPENVKLTIWLILGNSKIGIFWVMNPNAIPKTELNCVPFAFWTPSFPEQPRLLWNYLKIKEKKANLKTQRTLPPAPAQSLKTLQSNAMPLSKITTQSLGSGWQSLEEHHALRHVRLHFHVYPTVNKIHWLLLLSAHLYRSHLEPAWAGSIRAVGLLLRLPGSSSSAQPELQALHAASHS